MAHKYAIPDILDHALSRLKKYYTNDLAAWRSPDGRARYVAARDIHALTAISLARLTNTPSLLPTAFLLCTKLLSTWVSIKKGVPTALMITSLPVSDQLMLLSARERLLHMCAERTLRLLAAVPCARCTTPALCSAVREAPLAEVRDNNVVPGPPLFHQDVLRPLATSLWGDNWPVFCPNCRDTLRNTDERESKRVWSRLPTIFRVKLDQESWPTLPMGTH